MSSLASCGAAVLFAIAMQPAALPALGVYRSAVAPQAEGSAVPAAPEDGGPRNWEVMRALNLRDQPSTAAKVIARYVPGTILDNLGCRRAEGRIWCDVQQLGGGRAAMSPRSS